MGCNMKGEEAGVLYDNRKLIIDRDTKYCQDFRQLLESSGTSIIRLTPRSPNLNAYAERFVGSIKAECLNRLIFFGEALLRRALREYTDYYQYERNHQGTHNRLLNGAANDNQYSIDATKVACRSRLGGMLRYYYREAT